MPELHQAEPNQLLHEVVEIGAQPLLIHVEFIEQGLRCRFD